jgi:MoxR-like ATPase
MALAVGAPLLLTGEPGTGKTQVAWYLGWYFGIQVYAYQVRSTSTADDIKYDFDAVAYLRNAQDKEAARMERTDDRVLRHKALWEAYDDPGASVLLIDEIDKAPRDFPNDLLLELDKHEFQHPFLNKTIRPRHDKPPIVVITSNVERRLPDAFLRRCIFYHLKLTPELVQAAVRARAGDFPHLDTATQDAALDRFWQLYRHEQLLKRPSTAEVLVWLAILSAKGTTADELQNAPLAELPGLHALIKDQGDIDRLSR